MTPIGKAEAINNLCLVEWSAVIRGNVARVLSEMVASSNVLSAQFAFSIFLFDI